MFPETIRKCRGSPKRGLSSSEYLFGEYALSSVYQTMEEQTFKDLCLVCRSLINE